MSSFEDIAIRILVLFADEFISEGAKVSDFKK